MATGFADFFYICFVSRELIAFSKIGRRDPLTDTDHCVI